MKKVWEGMRWVVMGVYCLTGCATLSTSQTARPIPKGTSRWGAGLVFNQNILAGSDLAIPSVEISYRKGIDADTDMGFRVRPVAAYVDYKFSFARTKHNIFSFAPGIGVGGVRMRDQNGALVYLFEQDFQVPVLIGGFGGNPKNPWEWVFGPKVAARFHYYDVNKSPDKPLNTADPTGVRGHSARFALFGGAVVGFNFGLGKRWRLAVEENIYYDFTENTGIASEFLFSFFRDFGQPKN